MIEITLVYKGGELDIAIPNRITMERFQTLLAAVFKENNVELPDDVQFHWMDKNFQLGQNDRLSEFRIANGDRVMILVEEQKNA